MASLIAAASTMAATNALLAALAFVVQRLLARLGVEGQELVDSLAVAGTDARAGLPHHALDVALPLVFKDELAVDRARDRVALAAARGEQLVTRLHVGWVLGDVDLGGPLVVGRDSRIERLLRARAEPARETDGECDTRGERQQRRSHKPPLRIGTRPGSRSVNHNRPN